MKLKLTVAAVVVALLALAGCGSGSGSSGSDGTIKIQTFPGGILSLPEFVGVDTGIYKDNGLKVKLVSTDTGPAASAALVAGAVDVISNSPGNMLIPNSQGQKLVYVNNYLSHGFDTWLAQPTWPFPHQNDPYPAMVKDFKGARIGISAKGSQVELETRIMLKDAGLDPDKDVKFVVIGFGQQGFAAFKQKQVDIALSNEPMTSMVLGIGGKVVYDIADPAKTPPPFAQLPGNGRIALARNADKKKALFEKFNAAQAKVIEFMADPANLEKVTEIYAKYSKLDMDIARGIVKKYQPLMDIHFRCSSLSAVLNYLNTTGLLKDAKTQITDDCDTFMWSGSKDLEQQS